VSLAPGWVATHVVEGLGATTALRLRHIGGPGAAWFLNPDYSFKANTLDNLPDSERAEFTNGVAQAIGQAWQRLIAGPPLGLDDQARRYLLLGGTVLRETLRRSGHRGLPTSARINLDGQAADDAVITVGGNKLDLEIRRDRLDALFRRDFLNDALRAAAEGHLVLPSPFGGDDLSTDVSVCLTHSTMAYRFVTQEGGMPFYVVVSLWRAVVVALYVPALGLLINPSEQVTQQLKGFLGADVDTALFDHVLDHGIELESYLLAPRRTPTYVYSQDHLGHHLWNELSGLTKVATELHPAQIPEILQISGPNSEMYGRFDALFPQLAGRIDRTARSKDGLIHHAYRKGLCLFYPTAEYVSADLASRIVALAGSDPTLQPIKTEADDLDARGFLIVMLGLRVENRTVVDPVAFCAVVISTLREAGYRVAVVLDGHNGTDDGSEQRLYRSHAENLTSISPASAEFDIVHAIRGRFAEDRDVRVISTVGRPIGATVMWCRRAAFFVTPWGAGLAKYRWVCNQRGLVVASQRFFRFAGQRTVHLYDSPQFMEDPTPLNFVSPDDVDDAPDAPLLIGLNDGNRINFTVRPSALRQRLTQLLQSLGLRPARA
jgi:hypothetical protein